MQDLKKSETQFSISQDGRIIFSGTHQFAVGSAQDAELARMIAIEIIENYLESHSWEIHDCSIVKGEYFAAEDSCQFVISAIVCRRGLLPVL